MAFSQLRPLSFGEILDGSFTLYRRQFASMFLTALIPQIPLVICLAAYGVVSTTMLAGAPAQFDGATLAVLAVLGVLMLVALPAMAVGFGGVVFQVSRAYTGTPVGTREALRRGMQRVWPLVGSMLVLWLMMMVGLVFCIVPGLLVGIASFAVIPAVVLERRGPIQAIDRSFQLIRNAWIEVFLVVLVAYLISALPGGAVGMLNIVGLVVAGGDPKAAAGIQAGTQVLSALVRTITMPFSLGCTVLLYYDRRVRTEALDVQMMAESLHTAGGPEYPAGAGYAGGPSYPGGASYPNGPSYGGGGYPGASAYAQGAGFPGSAASYDAPVGPADVDPADPYGPTSRFARPRETPAAPSSPASDSAGAGRDGEIRSNEGEGNLGKPLGPAGA